MSTPFRTEAALQKAAILQIKAKYPRAYIFHNPQSELQWGGDERRRGIIARDLKQRGWNPGDPDLVVGLPLEPYGHELIGIELKRPKDNPFRIMRSGANKGRRFIEGNSEKAQHVQKQLSRLAELHHRQHFAFCCFCVSVKGVMEALKKNALYFSVYYPKGAQKKGFGRSEQFIYYEKTTT